MEAADAPSTPRAEAKRPSRSAPEPAPRTEAPEDAVQLSQEQPSTSANGHPPQHGMVDTTTDALLLQGSQSGLDNGIHTEEAASADVGPSSLSEPQHISATGPGSVRRVSADQAESDSGQQTLPLQAGAAAAALAAHQPGSDQQHAEVIELQRQRSLEIEAHLAQVRPWKPEHQGRLQHIQDCAAICRSFDLRSACSRSFISPCGLWAALPFPLVLLRMSSQV